MRIRAGADFGGVRGFYEFIRVGPAHLSCQRDKGEKDFGREVGEFRRILERFGERTQQKAESRRILEKVREFRRIIE